MRLGPTIIVAMQLAITPIAMASDIRPSSAAIEDLDSLGRQLAKDKCKNPKQVTVEHVANRYENVIDDIKTFQCPGYRIIVYEAHASNIVRELPMEVSLTRPVVGLHQKLTIGAAAEGVRTTLGSPYSEKEQELLYSTSEERPDEDTVTFHLKKGKVVGITWSWEVD